MKAWRFGSLVFGEGLRPTPLLLFFKREADGREGAISGRLARKATGVSPSDFARTGVFAENIPKLRGRTNRTYRTNRTGRRGRPFYTYAPLHPSPRRGVRSPFSVFRSPGRRRRPFAVGGKIWYTVRQFGLVVELADTQDLGSCASRREGSTPSGPINQRKLGSLEA